MARALSYPITRPISRAVSGTDLGGASNKVLRNIISSGGVPVNNGSAITLPKNRLVGTTYGWNAVAALGVVLDYMSARLATGGAVNSSDFTINKLNFIQGGTVGQPLFAGARNHAVLGGSLDDSSDMLSFPFAPGRFQLNFDITVSAAGYPGTKIYSSGTTESDGVAEVCWACDPAVTTGYDIDTFGASKLTIPSGGVAVVPIRPWRIRGLVPKTQRSVVGVGTSIAAGLGDLSSTSGERGGGYFARAAFRLGVPYISLALSGGAYTDINSAVGIAIQNKAFDGATDAWFDGPTNDIAAGQSQAQCRASLNAVNGRARAAGVNRTIANLVLPRCGTTDNTVTLGAQTVGTNFGVGGVSDGVNADMLLDVGAYYNAVADQHAIVADAGTPTKWAVNGFTTTLAAAALNSAATLSLAAACPVGALLICDPLNASGQKSSANFSVYRVLGAGPFSATANNPIGVAQNSGNSVQHSLSLDAIHPYGVVNDWMATALLAAA